jgi:serine phosphatase RsbU (regulator of sigma subunit)
MVSLPEGASSGVGTSSGVGAASTLGRRRLTDDDTSEGQRGVRTLRPGEATLAADRVRLLLQVAEGIHRSDDFSKLGEVALAAVAAGTRYGNVALLRPMAVDGSVEILALRTDEATSFARFRFSRSTLRQASAGLVVIRTAEDAPGHEGQSIADLHIMEAMCVPLTVDGVVVAFLYMDNRNSRRMGGDGEEDRQFAVAVGRVTALAWRNLSQRDMATRLATVSGELAAAARMQGMIMPAGSGRQAGVSWAGAYRPGRIVSGDFFDIVPLHDQRLALVVGDVSGKGVAAAVLAVLAQGFLRGMLLAGRPLEQVMAELHALVWARAEAERFVTLWLGVVDAERGLLWYVDAGHGIAHVLPAGGPPTALNDGGGPPLGALEEAQFQVIECAFPRDAMLLIASDGVVEQPVRAEAGTDRFGAERFLEAVQPIAGPVEAVGRVFDSLTAWAGGSEFADDATVLAARLT